MGRPLARSGSRGERLRPTMTSTYVPLCACIPPYTALLVLHAPSAHECGLPPSVPTSPSHTRRRRGAHRTSGPSPPRPPRQRRRQRGQSIVRTRNRVRRIAERLPAPGALQDGLLLHLAPVQLHWLQLIAKFNVLDIATDGVLVDHAKQHQPVDPELAPSTRPHRLHSRPKLRENRVAWSSFPPLRPGLHNELEQLHLEGISPAPSLRDCGIQLGRRRQQLDRDLVLPQRGREELVVVLHTGFAESLASTYSNRRPPKRESGRRLLGGEVAPAPLGSRSDRPLERLLGWGEYAPPPPPLLALLSAPSRCGPSSAPH